MKKVLKIGERFIVSASADWLAPFGLDTRLRVGFRGGKSVKWRPLALCLSHGIALLISAIGWKEGQRTRPIFGFIWSTQDFFSGRPWRRLEVGLLFFWIKLYERYLDE